jgi:hypothetical protein
MAARISANITVDDVAVSTTGVQATEDVPLCHGPITVYVDNGKNPGDIREKLATITVRLHGQKYLKTFTVGAKLKLPISIDGGDEIMLFDGMIYETSHQPVDIENVDVTLSGKDDKTRIEVFGSVPNNKRVNAHFTGLPDPPGQLYSLDQLTMFSFDSDSPKLVEYHHQIAAGNAWNDEADPTTDHWAWALGVEGFGDDNSSQGMFDRTQRSGELALLRYAIESGHAAYQAARYYGSIPYEIPAEYMMLDQQFEAELFTRINQQNLSLEYEHRISGTTLTPYVNPDNEEEQERFGVIAENKTFEGVWALDTDEYETDYPLSWEDRRELTSPHYFKRPWYQVEEAPVLLHRMIDDDRIGPAVVSDLLENIYDIRRRLDDDPYIPSVAITGAAIPMPNLELAGVIDVAELTITPRRGLDPRLDLAISLGPGDGYPAPYKTAPRPLIWSEAHYSWHDTKLEWQNAD